MFSHHLLRIDITGMKASCIQKFSYLLIFSGSSIVTANGVNNVDSIYTFQLDSILNKK